MAYPSSSRECQAIENRIFDTHPFITLLYIFRGLRSRPPGNKKGRKQGRMFIRSLVSCLELTRYSAVITQLPSARLRRLRRLVRCRSIMRLRRLRRCRRIVQLRRFRRLRRRWRIVRPWRIMWPWRIVRLRRFRRLRRLR